MQNKPEFAAQDIFHAALDYDAAGRMGFLSRVCGGDVQLRREVESLLASFEAAGDFLETPVVRDLRGPTGDGLQTFEVGHLIGRYRLTGVLSSGGMGEVYVAVRADGAFEQQVAIKIIRADALSHAARRRFEQERQTLAHLEHPYITRLIDGGATPEGRSYLVMEYVEGLTVGEFCRQDRLDVRQRLELFRKVCEAVHHAHRNLIVHRDLKPANILVTRDGTPKVLDFGIAKLLDGVQTGRSEVTAVDHRPMTPRYASPEQIKGEPVTTATDVYALGVLLYEMLTGLHPYPADTATDWDMARLICEVDPAPPSAAVMQLDERRDGGWANRSETSLLARQLRGDLDNIVLMAMHKSVERRYGSVQQLSEDVERYLSGAPVIARRDTFTYRASKWARRNSAVAMVSGCLLLALLVGVVGTSIGMVRAKSAQERAESERIAAQQAQAEAEAVTAFLQDTLAAANPYRLGRELGVIELLDQATARMESELADSPGVQAAVRYAIASTYAGMWEWTRAIPHLRIALRLSRERYGERSAPVADCLSLLGRALTFGRDAESVRLQAEGLEIRRRLFGEVHADVAESLGNLGYAEWHGQQPSDWRNAERHYRESLAMYQGLGIENDPDVARFTYSLGVMLSNTGRNQEAGELLKRALEIYAKLPATQDCYRARCMLAYAGTLRKLNRNDEAAAVLREMQAIIPPGFEDAHER